MFRRVVGGPCNIIWKWSVFSHRPHLPGRYLVTDTPQGRYGRCGRFSRYLDISIILGRSRTSDGRAPSQARSARSSKDFLAGLGPLEARR